MNIREVRDSLMNRNTKYDTRLEAARASQSLRTGLVAASLILSTGLTAVSPCCAAESKKEAKEQTKTQVKKQAKTSTTSSAAIPATVGTSTAALKPEPWRKDAPEATEPRPFKLPAVETYKLENGLKVQLVEDHRVPYVTVFLGFKAGKLLDDNQTLGVAQLTADMLTEGTGSRSSKELADQIDYIGGSLGAHTGYDFTLLNGSALSNSTAKLFELFSDVLLNPSFPEDEIKLKKANWLQALIMKRSQPSFLLEERFRKVIFGGHPYGIVAPHPDMVSAITQKDLVEFHKQHYIPNDAILLVLGDFDKSKMKELISNSLGEWQAGERKEASLPHVPSHKGRKIYLVNRPGSVQSSLKLGNLGIKKTDPDYFKILVMNEVLGGAAHSRLFANIRENKGYTYGAYSSSATRVHPDVFYASADVRTDVTAASLQEFLYELEKIRNLKPKTDELTTAKNYLTGTFQLGIETQAGLAQRLLEVSLYGLPDDYLETYTKKVMAVTPEDVRVAVRRIIQAKDLVITVVGDAEKIQPDLEMFAPVEVYSTEGEAVTRAESSSGSDAGSGDPDS